MKKIIKPNFGLSEKRLGNAQDRVMAGYKKRRAVRNKSDEQALHMFFSPNRVPEGLTETQIRQCIVCYPLRQWHKECWSASTLFGTLLGRPLPPGFDPGRPMTSVRFNASMRQFKAEVAMLLINNLAGVPMPNMMEIMKKSLEKLLRPRAFRMPSKKQIIERLAYLRRQQREFDRKKHNQK